MVAERSADALNYLQIIGQYAAEEPSKRSRLLGAVTASARLRNLVLELQIR